ncbi:Hypothetical predicted protein, partial [Paramuricea clavata]
KLKKVEKRMKKSTVIGNTNPILENVSPLSKPYVVKVKENVTTYLQDKQRGVTNNESNMKRGGSQIEENINGKESCSSELGHSSSYEIEADNITNSSIENDKGVNNSESNAGFDPNEENVHEKDSPNQIEESGQNSALPQLGDDHCFRKIKKESNGDERIDTNQENTPEKDSAFLQLGTAHDVCKTNVATYNEQTSNKYNIL